ncbi:MAG: lysophospholipase [Blastocatellia bacterium]|nr:lysophospholipase [Blastocatellia bacterium]MCS7156793.1 lysophospholipase [Blastocatellia bacterium]MCX7752751.1 lysophospholipase [Blastocatellia bacterium]MDW8167484.1 alpha/beta fold hydrolase [Acidobacteriota bacterium]MDW8256831.1 alpha/beta fold hydrolase [Acidobacteriota bacterium]
MVILELFLLLAVGVNGEDGSVAQAANALRIYVNEQPAGHETFSVTKTETHITWTGRASLELRSFSIAIGSFTLVTDAQYRPREAHVRATIGPSEQEVRTTFADGKARSEITVGGMRTTKEDSVSPDALVVLSNVPFFIYEVLAQRVDLSRTEPQNFRAYVLPQIELPLTVRVKGRERVPFANRAEDLIHLELALTQPTGQMVSMEMWVDDARRLIKLILPGLLFIEAYREGYEKAIASIAPKDYEALEVTFPSEAIMLAGTLTLPKQRSHPLPALVLIAGSGPHERDENVAGVKVFEQIADHLTRHGFAVLRYDKRGVGKSQGDYPTATTYDFADDAHAAVRFLRTRPEIAPDRIALIGHSEGAIVALLVAARDPKLAAIVLMAGPATSGEEVILEQQAYLLRNLPEKDRQERIAWQRKILEAVKTDRGWEEIERALPPEARAQLAAARSPWFREFVRLRPLALLEHLACPILILQGGKDTQVFPHHAEAFSRALQAIGRVPYEVKVFPTLNHLFHKAETGDISEYGKLTKQLDAEFLTVLTEWLRERLKGR